MIEITPVNSTQVHAAVMQRLSAARVAHASPTPAAPDRVELSAAARLTATDATALMERVNQLPEVRLDLIASIRARIADGSYERDLAAKLPVVIDRLVEDL